MKTETIELSSSEYKTLLELAEKGFRFTLMGMECKLTITEGVVQVIDTNVEEVVAILEPKKASDQ